MSIQFRTRSRGYQVTPEEITGACCIDIEGDVNNCLPNVSLRYCLDQNGFFQGEGSKCEDNICNTGSQIGSCCLNGF